MDINGKSMIPSAVTNNGGGCSEKKSWRIKVEASITDKKKRVCMCLGGVTTGNCFFFPCEEKQILRRIQVFQKEFMNVEIATNIEA